AEINPVVLRHDNSGAEHERKNHATDSLLHQKLTRRFATKTRLPKNGAGVVNELAPPEDGAEMRPNVCPLILRLGFVKCGVFVMAIPSSRNSPVTRSRMANRLRMFMSRSNKPGPLQFVTLAIVPRVPCCEFSKSI